MHVFSTICGAVLVFVVLLDAFETVVLPRRVTRHFRLTALFYRNSWVPWRKMAARIRSTTRRENFLGYFGPLSLLFLLALWALGLIFGFAFVQFGAGAHLQFNNQPVTFSGVLYHSGETFFTLGYGDIVPASTTARALSVIEAGMGFAFLGLVIGYIPTIYSSFSRREIEISLLDARAGSPPTAAEFLARFGNSQGQQILDGIFRQWERWAAEVLESHLSYPPLSFFRSQHSNQSWLGALTAILDTTALIIAGIDGLRSDQARLTFAMARHAVVDLSQLFYPRYDPSAPDRLPKQELEELRKRLTESGVQPRADDYANEKRSYLRAQYEPYAQAVAGILLSNLPPWMFPEKKRDNWQAGPWDRAVQARSLAALGARSAVRHRIEDHF